MLSVTCKPCMLSVVVLNVVMLSVIMSSVIMFSVVAQKYEMQIIAMGIRKVPESLGLYL
jgi:hypothetical protein